MWAAGLLALAFADPDGPGLLSVCGWRWSGVLDLLGWARCPGCGLGHAVAFLLDGRLTDALHAQPLAPFAVAVLLGRIAALLREAFAAPSPS